MESASVILDRNDKMFGQIYVENRETIPYEQLPRDLINAVVSVEDTKFYKHGGYDFAGIVRAALKNFTAGRVAQGASTITQQLARNSFALKEKTFRRKLLEIFLARRIEERFGKQKIMELYLNRIYFGGGLYGAEAASRGYFGKPARDMTLSEAATLAGLLKSPNRLSPWTDKNASRDARNVVLARMRDLGFISRERCETAQAEEIVIGSRQSAQGQTYAVDQIRQQVIAAVGWDRAMNEGYRIFTTIDAELQRVAEESLRAPSHRRGKARRLQPPHLRGFCQPLQKRQTTRRPERRPSRPIICRARSSRSITRRPASSSSSAAGISSTTNSTARFRRGVPPAPRSSRSFTLPPSKTGFSRARSSRIQRSIIVRS